MERRHVTFGSPDSASWLRPEAIDEVVWREGVPYRVLGIYFGGNPECQDDKLYQWWIGAELRPSDVPRWYVLDVEPGREREVEAALDDAYITCLLPCLFFGPVRPSKREEEGSAELLFPGYMFVRLAPADRGWEVVAGLPAVRGVVGFGGDPVPVPDNLPDSLVRLSFGSGCLVYRGGRLKDYGAEPLGDELSGFLSRPPDGDGRVRFLLDFLAGEGGGWGTGKTLKVLAVGSGFRRNQR